MSSLPWCVVLELCGRVAVFELACNDRCSSPCFIQPWDICRSHLPGASGRGVCMCGGYFMTEIEVTVAVASLEDYVPKPLDIQPE